MYNHSQSKPKSIWRKLFLLVVLLVIGGLLVTTVSVRSWYNNNLQPVSKNSNIIEVTIDDGMSSSEIGDLLQSKGVIKNSRAFQWYVRSSELRGSLKAGHYQLDSSNDAKQIAEIVNQGQIATNTFTILPGKRLDEIKQSMVNYGFDKNEVDLAFNPGNYTGHPALQSKPSEATLEGYLYPETFQTTKTTKPADIITKSLDEMASALTPEITLGFQKNGLTTHQGIILSSIVSIEVSSTEERAKAAQVFYKRLSIDMPLGSDSTYLYASAVSGQVASPDMDHPYNTRKFGGLPPGPISNVNKNALSATANPANTDYLFFVSGDDGITYFSSTQEEHERLTKEHCIELCKSY